MALPRFAPVDENGQAVEPSYGTSRGDDPNTRNVDLSKAYVASEAVNLRQVGNERIRYDNISTYVRDYIQSFFLQLKGTAGPFEWAGHSKFPAPVGLKPTLSEVTAGALPGTTNFVKFTWYSSLYGETTPSQQATITVVANRFVKVAIPIIPSSVEGWRVYASTTAGDERLQATITNASTWTQSAAWNGASAVVPTTNTLQPVRRYEITGPIGETASGPNLWNLTLNLRELF